MWVTIQDLIQISGMPNTPQGISYKAKTECWERRRVEGVKGRTYEYNILSLSVLDQARVLRSKNKVVIGNQVLEKPIPHEKNYCADALWFNFDKATDKQKEKAKFKTEVVIATKVLIDSGIDVLTAFDTIAKSHDCNPSKVRRWLYQVKGYEQADYLPVLLDKHNQRDFASREADMTPAAWDFFVADYFRLEQPALRTCYQTLCETAKAHGWTIPSLSSLRRKIEKDITPEQRVLWRKGEHALMQLYPAQQRTVADLDAREWINGDGYLHNVFVKL